MHGGYRPNAGRKTGSGRYKEPTKPVRIPLSRIEEVQALINDQTRSSQVIDLPLFDSKVAAGLPAVADDTIETRVNLSELLVNNPHKTFLVKTIGDSMINAGIYDGDLILVDQSIEAKSGHIVIASVNGELTVKRLLKTKTTTQLLPENPDFRPIDITSHCDTAMLGVVTHAIHPIS